MHKVERRGFSKYLYQDKRVFIIQRCLHIPLIQRWTIIFDGGALQDFGKWSRAALFYGGGSESGMEVGCRRKVRFILPTPALNTKATILSWIFLVKIRERLQEENKKLWKP